MNRTIAGIPLWGYLAAVGLGIGAVAWIRKRSTSASSSGSSPATAGRTGAPAFTQAQEVQDFQIFSALTGAQQASDLNFLSEVAGLFSGGSSTSSPVSTTGGAAGGGGGGSAVPSPPPTGSAPPATVPTSKVGPPAAPPPQTLPGYGAGLGELEALNPGILAANSPGGPNIPGITGYPVTYNGVPL